MIAEYKPYLSNMLGLVRGNIYYNLMSWYRCLSCIPVGDTSKYMETMMGVKQTLEPELEAELGLIQQTAPKYGCFTKLKVLGGMVHKGEAGCTEAVCAELTRFQACADGGLQPWATLDISPSPPPPLSLPSPSTSSVHRQSGGRLLCPFQQAV